MSAKEKSDVLEVAEKRAIKAASAAAELVERRGGAKECGTAKHGPDDAGIHRLPRTAAQGRVGGLCQEAVRRTRGGARLSRSLHPPRRHSKQPLGRMRTGRRHL